MAPGVSEGKELRTWGTSSVHTWDVKPGMELNDLVMLDY